MSRHVLEPAAQEFAEAAAKPPLLHELGPAAACKILDDVQAGGPVALPRTRSPRPNRPQWRP